MLFSIDPNSKKAKAIAADSFADLAVTERYDIQEWVLNSPELLGEDLMIITSEFDQFDRTSERLDVLAVDRSGKVVVAELKRSAVGTAAELQALRYAAYCSTLTLDDLADLHAQHVRRRNGADLSREAAREAILDFVTDPDFEDLDDKPRIILAAERFPPEMMATLLWLRTFELDISAVRLRPYQVNGALVVDSAILIPLPEAREYLVRREKKEVEQKARNRGRAAAYQPFFQRLIDELRERHRFTNARIGQPQSWYSFASGFGGISLAAAFSKQGLRTEVYIDTGDKTENKRIFDGLMQQRAEIETAIDEGVSWERLDNRRASRIAIYRETTIEDSEDKLDDAHSWAVAKLLKFKDVFGPRLAELVD